MKKVIITIIMSTLMILGINNVYADTIGWTSKYSRIYYDDHGTERNYNFLSMPHTHTSDYPITQMEYRLQYSGGFSSGNTYTFSVDYTPNPDTLYVTGLWFSDGTNRFTDVNCGGWSRTNNGSYTNLCAVSPPVDIPSNGYIYVRIVYASSYVDSLTSGVSNFSITKGTGAIIQDSAIDIMNNQNQLMTTQCTNIFNFNNLTNGNGATHTNSDNSLTINSNGNEWAYVDSDYEITPNTTYNINFNVATTRDVTMAVLAQYNYGTVLLDESFNAGSHSFTFNSGNNTRVYLRFFASRNYTESNTATFSKIMLSKDNSPYCPYGSSTNKLDELNNTLNQDTTYNNNASENLTQEKNKMNEYKNREDTLMNSLDFSQVDDLNITINPNASSFIWDIINRLRQMNSSIVLLMTSVLGLGIIKMILNR